MFTGAEILIKCLEKEEVSVIFGYPGGASLDILDGLLKSKQIRHILVRHEQGAAHAASGYARVSGKAGVCLVTSGPGATNLVTGIATAYMDSIPVVFITGQVSTGMVGTDAFQEVDITGVTDPITKHNYLVKDAQSIPRIVKEAFYIAKSGRPGPVLIDIPKDVLAGKLDYQECTQVELRGYKPKVTGHGGQVKQVSELLLEAKCPVICAGGGVISAGASGELLQMAETLNIPVINTLMGLGSISLEHPLALGMLGTYGLSAANMVVQECDLFIALGMRFDDRVTGNTERFAPGAKIIHIDIDAAEIGKNVRCDVPLVGDLKIILNQINTRLENKTNPEWWRRIQELHQQYPPKSSSASGLTPSLVLERLNRILPSSVTVTTDVGQHQLWTAKLLKFKMPRSFLSSGGLGTMGYGIPAAVGAQVANPHQPVVVITGDGSFQMGLPELGTALEQDLPLKIVLMNNQSLALVRQLQEDYCGGRYSAVHFQKNPDFGTLAKAYGALSLKVTKPEELDEALQQLMEHPGMVVLEAVIQVEEQVLPIVLSGYGLHEMCGLE